jgi:hypothetical protein
MTPPTEEQKARESERLALHRAAMKRVGSAFPVPKAQTRHEHDQKAATALQEAANDRLNRGWLAARQDLISMDEFKAILLGWERDQAEAIRILKRK